MTGKTKPPRQPRPKQGSSAAEVPPGAHPPRTAASCRRRSSTDFHITPSSPRKRKPITTKVSDGRGIAPSGLRDIAHHQRDGVWVPAFRGDDRVCGDDVEFISPDPQTP